MTWEIPMADLDELFAALSDLASAPGGAKATSVRQPEATGGSSSRRRSAQKLDGVAATHCGGRESTRATRRSARSRRG
jgi:hypothetical protein